MKTVAFSPDGKHIASGSHDNLVKIWVAETGAEVSSFERSRSLWSGDGVDCMLTLGAISHWMWSEEVGVEGQVCTLTGHTGCVNSVSFSRDGKHIVSGSDDDLVKIWNVETGAEVSSLGWCTL